VFPLVATGVAFFVHCQLFLLLCSARYTTRDRATCPNRSKNVNFFFYWIYFLFLLPCFVLKMDEETITVVEGEEEWRLLLETAGDRLVPPLFPLFLIALDTSPSLNQ
jgi:hypothetical protein